MRVQRIPSATVARLPMYVQGLKGLAREGVRLVSSQKLAEATGVDAPQIRRDLSYLGAFGTPGVGYDVNGLLHEVSHCLGLSRTWKVALVGFGKLGSALATHVGFPERNFHIAAIFDANPAVVGTRFGDLEIQPPERLSEVVAELCIDIAIIATPAACAQEVADRLVASGVTCILNLAPATLQAPEGVNLRSIDLAVELQILSIFKMLKNVAGGHYPVQAAMQRGVFVGHKERL